MNLKRKFAKAASLIADGDFKELVLDVLMQFSFGHELIRNVRYLYLRRKLRHLMNQHMLLSNGEGG
ncbi:MAG: hypothetical protein IJU31_05665 [Synergistaceae bacterium]|nr:hypothetical protein [Synergistaceae bacterium]